MKPIKKLGGILGGTSPPNWRSWSCWAERGAFLDVGYGCARVGAWSELSQMKHLEWYRTKRGINCFTTHPFVMSGYILKFETILQYIICFVYAVLCTPHTHAPHVPHVRLPLNRPHTRIPLGHRIYIVSPYHVKGDSSVWQKNKITTPWRLSNWQTESRFCFLQNAQVTIIVLCESTDGEEQHSRWWNLIETPINDHFRHLSNANVRLNYINADMFYRYVRLVCVLIKLVNILF